MLFASNKLKKITFDVGGFTKTLDMRMGEVVREAARQWLRAVITSVPSARDGDFPVYTGMAKASLIPLGRFLRVAVPVHPIKQYKDKNMTKGIAAGRAPRGGWVRDDHTHPMTFVYSFKWQSAVDHYETNELTDNGWANLIAHRPWNTLEAGNAAFRNHVREAIHRKLPKIKNYLNVVESKRGSK